eukprot:g4918.t1
MTLLARFEQRLCRRYEGPCEMKRQSNTATLIPNIKRQRPFLHAHGSTHGSSRPKSKCNLVLKPLRRDIADWSERDEQRFQMVEQALDAMRNSSTSLPYAEESLYQAVQSLCLNNHSSRLCQTVMQHCQNTTSTRFEEMSQAVSMDLKPLELLGVIEEKWLQHLRDLHKLCTIFGFLDRTYCKDSSLWSRGIASWCKCLEKKPEFATVSRRSLEAILTLIEEERRGGEVKRNMLRVLVDMYWQVGLYGTVFEDTFLLHTKNFYSNEASTLLSSDKSVDQYLHYVQSRLKNEHNRVSSYLKPTTLPHLVRCLEVELVQKRADRILRSEPGGFPSLMENPKLPELTLLFHLMKRVDGLKQLQEAFIESIIATGTQIVRDKVSEDQVVPRLLEFKRKLDSILETSFQNDEGYRYNMKRAFEKFLNEEPNRPAQLVAKYIHSKLRFSRRGAEAAQLTSVLTEIVFLLRYLQAKDMFQAFYRKDLASRLLLDRSASRDAEQFMIARVQEECGSSFTQQLESMFQDMDLSQDVMKDFLKQRAKQTQAVACNFRVLTHSSWPNFVPANMKLTPQLSEVEDAFRVYYLQKYKGRKLAYQYSLGTADLRANFPKGRKELSVSAFQARVLLCFNQASTLTLVQLIDQTGLDREMLIRVLLTLSTSKARLLLKEPNVKAVKDDDVFSVNLNFSHQQIAIKCNQMQGVATAEESFKTTERIFEDRQYALDAAIVRIMKSEKTMLHNELVKKVRDQVKFPAQIADIKKRISSLIELEYLSRDAEKSDVYIYKA